MTLDFYSLIQGLHQTISLGVIDLVCSNLYSSLMDDINDMSYSVKISYSILMWEIPKTVPVSHLLHFCRDVAKAYCFCISCCVAETPTPANCFFTSSSSRCCYPSDSLAPAILWHCLSTTGNRKISGRPAPAWCSRTSCDSSQGNNPTSHFHTDLLHCSLGTDKKKCEK